MRKYNGKTEEKLMRKVMGRLKIKLLMRKVMGRLNKKLMRKNNEKTKQKNMGIQGK